MEALKAIGLMKAFRFVLYSWYTWVLHISLPPLRTVFLRLAGAQVGTDTVIMDVSWINLYQHGFSKIRIGDRCFIGDGVLIDARGGFTMEDDVTLSHRASVVTHINVGYASHPLQKQYPEKERRVTLKHGSYIGLGASILPGVTVGTGSLVAAGSIVTKDVPDSVMAAGVPAVVKKTL